MEKKICSVKDYDFAFLVKNKEKKKKDINLIITLTQGYGPTSSHTVMSKKSNVRDN